MVVLPTGVNNNLIPSTERTQSEHRQNAQAGGRASGEARREKKRLRDCAELLLSLPVKDIDKFNNMCQLGIPVEDIDNRMLMVTGLLNQACKGDTSAAREIRSLIGEDVNSDAGETVAAYTGLPARVIGKAYADINRDIDAELHTFYDFEGGRGTLKSSFCGLKLIDKIMLDPNICGLAIKQLKNDLKDSVYSQIVWAIDELGLTDEFHCTTSPMQIRRKSTGQIIFFRGGDDPNKIKSIKTPHGMHIGIVWIEEADQIHGEAAYRNIQQSAGRGGKRTMFFRSYNVPRSKQHYINVEKREHNPTRVLHHSHFTDVPREWLGETFFQIAEQLKKANPTAYAHEYDGEAVGNGANVFDNIEERPITKDEIDTLDMFYYGLDWGFVHPTAFNEMAYDEENMILYIFGEKHLLRTTNRQAAEELEEYKHVRITADNASPESIADLRDWGYDIRAAVKGPGSRDYSYKWLASLAKIVIDSGACPETAHEFVSMEYVRDKDGKLTSEIPKVCDDHIDAIRYGMEPVWKRRGR